jgi:Protein of unknown function (DUF2911)
MIKLPVKGISLFVAFVFLVFARTAFCEGNVLTQESTTPRAAAEIPNAAPSAVRASPNIGKAACTLQDGKHMAIEYSGLGRATEPWVHGVHEAGNFDTTADLFLGGQDVPAGSYELYILPGQIHWTLIFSRKIDRQPISYPGPENDVARVHLLVSKLEEPAGNYSVELLPYKDDYAGLSGCRWRFQRGQTRASMIVLEKHPEYALQVPPELEKLRMLADWTWWETVLAHDPSACGGLPCLQKNTTLEYRLDFTVEDVSAPDEEIFRIRKRIHRFLLSNGWAPKSLQGSGDVRTVGYQKGPNNISVHLGCGSRLFLSGCDEIQMKLFTLN